jgi:hypothetical protein
MNFLDGDLEEGGWFVGEGLRVPGIAGKPGKGRVLGVRPEDLAMAAQPGDAHLTTELFSFEVTGESAYATGRFGKDLLVAGVTRDFEGEIGEPLGLRIDGGRAHLFDRATGSRLGD